MLRFGIYTQTQFTRMGQRRRYSGARVSYTLLNVGARPTEEQIRTFEDVNFTLQTSNGTYRTTFRNRLQGVDDVSTDILRRIYGPGTRLVVQDRAVSHGLTSLEWAQQLLRVFPNLEFEASDRLTYLIQLELPSGEKYILEPGGQALQYINPPFVVGLLHKESPFYPVNRLVAAFAKRRLRHFGRPESIDFEGGNGFLATKIQCVHPEAVAFQSNDSRFELCCRSVFDTTPDAAHVLRTMNILNKDYFSDAQLEQSVVAIFESVKLGGVWIVGRTLESDFSHHVSILQKQAAGWKVLERLGNGSEMEEFAGLNRPDKQVGTN
jgi:hypothetical protein